MLGLLCLPIACSFNLAKSPDAKVNVEREMSAMHRPAFVENLGQWDQQVRYMAKTGNLNVWVKSNGLVYEFSDVKGDRTLRHAVEVAFVGSNPTMLAQGDNPLPAKSNYLIGRDKAQWASASSFGTSRITNLYAGIDLVLYFDKANNRPRYDFIVHPGADPKQIRMKYNGVEKLALQNQNAIRYQTSLGTVLEQDLKVYQSTEEKTNRIPAKMVLVSRNTVSFGLGRYDHSRDLVIDPLIFSTFMGGSANDGANGVTTDSDGNIYVCGFSQSTNFPVTAGAFQTISPGGANSSAFISKLTPDGTQLIYSTYLGGTLGTQAYSIAVDSTGAAFVSGRTSSKDFPTTAGSFQPSYLTSTGFPGDSFVVKLSPNGSSLVYSTYFGAGNRAQSIAIDSTGAAYIAGGTTMAFPVTASAFQKTYGGNGTYGGDAFLAKLNSTGSALIYATYLGGRDGDWGNGVAIDSTGNAYVTGYTYSDNFPVTSGAYQTTYRSTNKMGNVFVAKVAPNGSSLVYGTYLGGAGSLASQTGDWGNAIRVDSNGNAFVGGYTSSSNFPVTTVAAQKIYGGNVDGFVTMFNAAGSSLLYSSFLGGAGLDDVRGIALDSAGTVWVTGATYSSNFPTTTGAYQTSVKGNESAYLTNFAADGSKLLSSTYFGGSTQDWGMGVAIDLFGSIVFIGVAESSDFPTVPGSLQTTYGGGSSSGGDAFVAKFGKPPISFGFAPKTLTGGKSTTGTVILGVTAPAGGKTINLGSASSLVTVPATVTVLEGQTTVNFEATTSAVNASTNVNVTASATGLGSATTSVTLTPAVPESVVITPVSVYGGQPTSVSGVVKLNAPAGSNGTVVTLASNNSSATVPATVKVLAGALTAKFAVSHKLVSTDQTATTSATANGVTVSSTFKVLAILPKSLTLSPGTVIGETFSTAKVILNANAPIGGLVVTLASSSSNAKVPSSVTIAAGASNATFTVNTLAPIAQESVTISATVNGKTVSAILTLKKVAIATVTLTPTSVKGGSTTTVNFTVKLNAPAPTGGQAITLKTSSTAIATIVASAVIPAGTKTATYKVTTFAVTAIKVVNISGTVNGGTATAKLTVNP